MGRFLEAQTFFDHGDEHKEDYVLRSTITIIGVCLFIVDMVLLFLFYRCISNILEHYQKEYAINKVIVWSSIGFVSFTYVIEMIWSDLFVWGGLLNIVTSLKIAGEVHVNFEFIIYTLMTINAILSNYYQGVTILIVFNSFAKKKY